MAILETFICLLALASLAALCFAGRSIARRDPPDAAYVACGAAAITMLGGILHYFLVDGMPGVSGAVVTVALFGGIFAFLGTVDAQSRGIHYAGGAVAAFINAFVIMDKAATQEEALALLAAMVVALSAPWIISFVASAFVRPAA